MKLEAFVVDYQFRWTPRKVWYLLEMKRHVRSMNEFKFLKREKNCPIIYLNDSLIAGNECRTEHGTVRRHVDCSESLIGIEQSNRRSLVHS